MSRGPFRELDTGVDCVLHLTVSKVLVRTDMECNIIVIRGVATLVFHILYMD